MSRILRSLRLKPACLGIWSLFVRLVVFDSRYLLGYDGHGNRMLQPHTSWRAVSADDIPIHLEELDMLLASAVALLAFFAFVSILLSSDEGREGTDPRDHMAAWTRYGMR